MPRRGRIEYEGAFYHVISRGNKGFAVFPTDDDRAIFMRGLGEAARERDVILYAFCLLSTHFHLLVETRKPNLSKFMHDLLSNYAHRHNRRSAVAGHVFRDRYNALLCERGIPISFISCGTST